MGRIDRGIFGCSVPEAKKNPFDESVDFESFVPYEIAISEVDLAKAKNDTPLKMYKYLLLKMCTDKIYDILSSLDKRDHDEYCDTTLKIVKEAKEEYKTFLRRGIPVNAEEKKNLRSAYGVVRLADMIQTTNKHTKLFFTKLQGKDMDFLKLKEVCGAILEGSSGVMCIPYCVNAFEMMTCKYYFKICRFVLCFMTELVKKEKNFRAAKGIIPGSFGLNYMLKNADWCILNRKIICLVRMLAVSDILHNLGHIDKFKFSFDEDEIGKSLMDELADCDKTGDEFYEVSMRPENYEEAKKVYDLILKYIGELMVIRCGSNRYAYECKQFEYCAHGHFAGFCSDPDEIYKLCQKSNDIIMGLYDNIYDLTTTNMQPYFTYGVMDLNYRRMWNIKLDIYKKDKSMSNLNALKKIAGERIKLGDFLHHNCIDIISALWWVNFDMVKCYLQVYQDLQGAKKHAESLYRVITMQPAAIPILIKLVGLDPRTMGCDEFVKKLINKLK